MRFSKALNIAILMFVVASCSSGKRLYISHDSTLIKIDSIHLKIISDSISRDTVRYSKQYFYSEQTPKTLHGAWYVIGAAIFLIIIFLIKR